MHRTLKQETAMPPASSLPAQQRAFDRFRRDYNHERPHEALGQQTPASWYEASRRPLPVPGADEERVSVPAGDAVLVGARKVPGPEGARYHRRERARPVFERVFREAGLPLAISTDDGPTFAAPRDLRGWSVLSVWWIRLGIRPLRTEPASPEQNGQQSPAS
jgi:hypothetical protein